MLTRDLLRCAVADGKVVPKLLKATPANLALAERVVAYWRAGIGQRRGELEDGLTPVLHQSRALQVARGMSRLVLDGCRFAESASAHALRERALVASAGLMSEPAATSDAHRAAVAAVLAVDPEALRTGLYGDLPDFDLLEDAPEIPPRRLIEIYNLSLCQGLLLSARALRVEIGDTDTGMRRKLLKSLRFRRLLAEVSHAGDSTADAAGGDADADANADRRGVLRLEISGPASVLDQASRYGMQLAQFLPALACARHWRAEAEVTVNARIGGRSSGTLELSDASGLVGDTAFLGHVPEELKTFGAALRARFPEWRLQEAQLLPLPSGELVVPDLQIVVAGRTVAVEFFHRWHASALARRLEQLARGLAPLLAIGVDRALAKTSAVAPLLASPAFARHGFLFSDIPVPRALAEAVERLAPTGTPPAVG